MKHRSLYTLGFLAGGILWLTGTAILLIPSHVQVLLETRGEGAALSLGVLFILSALANILALLIPSSPRQSNALFLFGSALLGLLGWLHLQAGLHVEGMLILCLTFAHLAALHGQEGEDGRFNRNPLPVPLLAANTLAGLALLLLPSAIGMPLARWTLAGLFLGSAAAGGLAVFRPSLRAAPLLEKALALPWLLWVLARLGTPGLIAPGLLVAVFLAGPSIPWAAVVLPENDILGRRLLFYASAALCISAGFLAAMLKFTDLSLLALQAPAVALKVREASFIMFSLGAFALAHGILAAALTINGVMHGGREALDVSHAWRRRVERFIHPLMHTQDGLRARLDTQEDQINALSRQLAQEKRRTGQLTLLVELSQQLEAQLDQPVAAQLTINTLERAIPSSFICLYLHEPERREYVALATAGRMLHRVPPGYRQSITQGVLGRVTHTRKTQVIYDTRLDPHYITFNKDEPSGSCILIPLIYTGHIKGVIEIVSEQVNAFSSADVALAETMSMELVRAWERSSYQYRLMELIQAGISLSTMIDPEATVQEIASIARRTLEARFAYVSLLFDREGNLTQKAHAGQAPRLLESLDNEANHPALLRASMTALQPFRVRDIRKYSHRSGIEIDHNGLRSLLVVPIRLHRLNIGSILAFGKQGEVFFTENDEALARLLASEAAAAIESVWLQQELRTTLRTTRLLYELSYQIIQAGELREAARHIAETAHRLAQAVVTGIVLFSPNLEIEAELEIDSTGVRLDPEHPMDMVGRVVNSGRVIYQSIDQHYSRVCLPIQTPMRKYGALWLTIQEIRGYKSGSPADLQTLANQAALALERAILLVESRRQAHEIEAAYRELERAYDNTLAALMSALDARDRETEGHSARVSRLAVCLGEAIDLSAAQIKALERGSLLHDIGKIGISDTILHKPGPLTEREWASMRRHPDIGAHIVEGIPFLQETLPVIRHHQERWDGSGYPSGLMGREIPLLARVFAVVDAFDALTSHRPYRQKIPPQEAIVYLREEAGRLFDPEIVDAFEKIVQEGHADFLHAQ